MKKNVPKSKIQILESQLKELTQALQRERADAINLRRRAEEEKIQASSFYRAMVIGNLLPAIDNLERALMHTPKNLKGHEYVKGVQGVFKQFEQCLQQLGVERIKTKSEPFDPHLHEAVHMEDGEGHSEIISQELRAGYKIGDEVIRPAMVKVMKGK